MGRKPPSRMPKGTPQKPRPVAQVPTGYTPPDDLPKRPPESARPSRPPAPHTARSVPQGQRPAPQTARPAPHPPRPTQPKGSRPPSGRPRNTRKFEPKPDARERGRERFRDRSLEGPPFRDRQNQQTNRRPVDPNEPVTHVRVRKARFTPPIVAEVRVLYEDPEILAIDKPAGLNVAVENEAVGFTS